MGSIEVVNLVRIHEEDGLEPNPSKNLKMKVMSHWSDNKRVVLQFRGGRKMTVVGDDLIEAIYNAMNTG